MHIDWEELVAESSFLLDINIVNKRELYRKHFYAFFRLIKINIRELIDSLNFNLLAFFCCL